MVISGMYHITHLVWSNRKKISKQTLSKIPTELHYVERSPFMKEVSIRIVWSFELGIQEGTNVCMWIFVGFQQKMEKTHKI